MMRMVDSEDDRAERAFFGTMLFWFTVIGLPFIAICFIVFAVAQSWLGASIFGGAFVVSLLNLRRFRGWARGARDEFAE